MIPWPGFNLVALFLAFILLLLLFFLLLLILGRFVLCRFSAWLIRVSSYYFHTSVQKDAFFNQTHSYLRISNDLKYWYFGKRCQRLDIFIWGDLMGFIWVVWFFFWWLLINAGASASHTEHLHFSFILSILSLLFDVIQLFTWFGSLNGNLIGKFPCHGLKWSSESD